MASADTAAAWFTLGGTLSGVLLTSAAALVTASLNHRWQSRNARDQFFREQAKQLRQDRQTTYLHHWAVWSRFNHQIGVLGSEVQKLDTPSGAKERLDQERPDLVARLHEFELEWREAVDGLLLLGGDGVTLAAEEFIGAAGKKLVAAWSGEQFPTTEAYEKLNRAMRTELTTLSL